MHNLKLWSPLSKKNNINKFVNSLKNNNEFKSYDDLHKWSIENKKDFWLEVWKFTKIIGDIKGTIYSPHDNFIECKYFEESKINYTENCLSKNDGNDQ